MRRLFQTPNQSKSSPSSFSANPNTGGPFFKITEFESFQGPMTFRVGQGYCNSRTAARRIQARNRRMDCCSLHSFLSPWGIPASTQGRSRKDRIVLHPSGTKQPKLKLQVVQITRSAHQLVWGFPWGNPEKSKAMAAIWIAIRIAIGIAVGVSIWVAIAAAIGVSLVAMATKTPRSVRLNVPMLKSVPNVSDEVSNAGFTLCHKHP